MSESDWGTRLKNKGNSEGASNTNKSNSNKPKFGTQVLNEGYDPANNGFTRYEISEKHGREKDDREKH